MDLLTPTGAYPHKIFASKWKHTSRLFEFPLDGSGHNSFNSLADQI